jgi:hypothetical protein
MLGLLLFCMIGELRLNLGYDLLNESCFAWGIGLIVCCVQRKGCSWAYGWLIKLFGCAILHWEIGGNRGIGV